MHEENTTPEEWRPIPGWEKWEVSDLGRTRNARTKRLRNPTKTKRGYLQTFFSDNSGSRTLSARIHSLVARAFMGAKSGDHVRHINDIPWDNRLCNLALGSQDWNRVDFDRNNGLIGVQAVVHFNDAEVDALTSAAGGVDLVLAFIKESALKAAM